MTPWLVRVRVRVRVGVTVRLRVTATVTVRVRVRVAVAVTIRGGDLFPHTRACKAGLSGMRFTEGERDFRVRVRRILCPG